MTQKKIYQNEFPYFITFKTKNRNSFFDDFRKAELLHRVIVKSCVKKGFVPAAFCILNNHVHLLIQYFPARAAVPAPNIPAAAAGRGGVGQGCIVASRVWNEGKPVTLIEAGGERVKQLCAEFIHFFPARAAVPAPNIPAAAAGRGGGMNGYTVSDIMHGIKSYYCHQLQEKFNINYSPWHKRYNFRIIDNEKRLYNTIQYIKYNYHKHGLPEKYSRYPYLYTNINNINDLFF